MGEIEHRAGLELERLDGGVLLVRLARGAKRNTIDMDTAKALTDLFFDANSDSAIRSILLTGQERNYCTGAEVGAAPVQVTTLDYRYVTEAYRRLFQAMWEVEKPVVAAVNGTVAGAGWMFALLADFVVADQAARWTHVFARRGMVPHAGDPYFLPRIIPFHILNEIAMLSDTLTSVDLHNWHLVHRCVDAESLMPTAMELAGRLAAGPTRALGLTKRLYRRSLSSDISTAFEDERNATALLSTTSDRREGVMSLVEGRPPNFIGN